MECKEAKELIVALSAGDLENPEAATLLEHTQTCGDCAEFIQRSDSLWAVLDHAPEVVPSEDYINAFWLKVEEAEQSESKGWFGIFEDFKQSWAIPAALTAMLFLTIITFSVLRTDSPNLQISELDREDELLMSEVDESLARDTASLLAIYGPWESYNGSNGGTAN